MQAQFFEAHNDTLVTFQKTGGSSGLQLVPHLALAMPAVSADGTAPPRYAADQPRLAWPVKSRMLIRFWSLPARGPGQTRQLRSR
jgi:hypothetical protein